MPQVGLPSESGLSRFVQGQAVQYGRGIHYRVRVRSFDAVISLVEAGVGIAIVPETAARRMASPKIGVIPLEDAWAARYLLLCTTSETAPEGQAGALLNFLSRAAR